MSKTARQAPVAIVDGKTFEIRSYAGAGHAFFNDTGPDAYRPDAAADAWPRAVAFLRRHLARPG